MYKALNVNEIPLSDVRSVVCPEHFIPEYLVIDNGDVLVKRKKKKLLTYPTFTELTYKFKYCMVLLFFPLSNYAQIEEEDLNEMYYRSFPNNDGISIVETTIR